MKNHMGIFILAMLVVAALLVGTVAFKVDFTEQVLVKQFGRTIRVYGGDEAGLHFKWPWPVQRVVSYDGRTQMYEGVYSQIQTRDGQTLLVSMWSAWRVADPVKFHTNTETFDNARARIETLLQTIQKETISQMDMGEIINTDPARMQIGQLEQRVQERMRQEMTSAKRDYGIEIVRVGVRNLGLPTDVSAAVIDAMKAERQRYKQQYESAGNSQAEAIRSRARAASDEIMAFANRKAQAIRSEGDAAAAEYYAKFEQNPGLSMFLRSLESLKKELKSRTVILLDGSEIPGVKFFRDGPSLVDMPAATNPAPNGPKATK